MRNQTARRVVAACVVLCLCTCVPGCIFGGGREPARLTSNNPGSKIPAIKRAADSRDSQTARQLVKSLDDSDPAIRFYAIRGLQRLTGETFGYVWFLDEGPKRRESVENWKRWLDANEGSIVAGSEHQDPR